MNQAVKIPEILRKAGTEKLTLAGGEPTLCSHLREVLQASKEAGLTTMIISNGTRLNKTYLSTIADLVDWIALSVDSASEQVEKALGRGDGNHVALVREVAKRIHEFGIRFKVNTVVTSMNWGEDMRSFVAELKPRRWKVFQMLPIKGENDDSFADLATMNGQFEAFVARHECLNPVKEDNRAMTDSYLMMDPLGRFFQNTGGSYGFGPSILEVGVQDAIQRAGWDRRKFLVRGGHYQWRPGGKVIADDKEIFGVLRERGREIGC
jgi:radical S-adenosyl methionine domain-containing protein 2